MESVYQPQKYESKIYKLWEKKGFFNPDKLPGKKRVPYTIVIPPPNVTGSLHMGHALNNTIQDILIRFYRMNGYKTLWIPGTDHAGIATQNVVEKELKKEGLTRHQLGKEKFIKRVWQWVKKYKKIITSQLKKLGFSCDWSRERFTLDKDYIKAVETAFLHYYKKGLIYRGPRIVNWCPRCETAISDIEVKYQEVKGKLYYIKYPLKDNKEFITVATTRPETMLGDVAVAVNPKDERYRNLVGRNVILPLVNREIPIIAHQLVDPNFGSGVVKITPAHDSVDWQIAKEKKLPFINVIGPDGKITEKGGKYVGLSVLEAREKIIEDLKLNNLLEKEEEYTYNLAFCDRCHTPIEPQISIQWFLKMEELKKPAIKVVKKGKIKIIPERYKKIYLDWLKKAEDWCISRQLWWGHSIPVWRCKVKKKIEKTMGFDKEIYWQVFKGKRSTWRLRDHQLKEGDRVAFVISQTQEIFGYGIITKAEKTTVSQLNLNDKKHFKTYKNRKELIEAFKKLNPSYYVDENTPVFVYEFEFERISEKDKGCNKLIISKNKPKKCPICGNRNFEKIEDVLDTWFSSALWPFATLGWPRETKDLKIFYPTNFLSTAQEILYLWVARMIFSSLEFTGQIPFKEIYIHPTVLAITGKRMSKSLGTGVDPVEIGEKYGFDAVRMGLIYQINRDQQSFKFDERTILASRNFINKLWNISRFFKIATKNFSINKSKILNLKKLKSKNLTLADKWILSRLNTIIDSATKRIKNYELGETIRELYNFVWHEFADWYIEIAKIQLEKKELKENTISILKFSIFNILKTLHPFIPFVTETIWQKITGSKSFLIVAEWPQVDKKLINKKSETDFEKIKNLIIEIRNWRKKENVPFTEIKNYKIKKSEKLIWQNKEIIERLAKVFLVTEENK